jgi:single-strand DNA-binding protein
MFNQAIILGRLGRDPEPRTTSRGESLCTFTVATTSAYTDPATGERKESTEWHRVICYGAVADIVCARANKGDLIMVEGPIFTREYTDKTGAVKKSTEIKGIRARVIPRSRNENGTGGESLGAGVATEDIPF